MQHVTRGVPGVASLRGCALFEPADGQIRHLHRVATLEGAEEISGREVEERARKVAAECGIDEARLEAVEFDPRELDPNQRYRVDPKTKRLVATGVVQGPGREQASRE